MADDNEIEIEVPEDVYEVISAAAERLGVTPEEFIVATISEMLAEDDEVAPDKPIEEEP